MYISSAMTPRTHVTVGLIQDAVTGDQTQTLTATIARIREAAGRGAQIICLQRAVFLQIAQAGVFQFC